MPTDLPKKLRIREGQVLRTINAPAGFADTLGPLPAGVTISSRSARPDQVHWFVRNRAEMEAELPKAMALVTGDVLCWIYYPKGTSGIQTDLTRDKGWDRLLAQENIQWVTLVSFDDTWSAFAMRRSGQEKANDREKQPRAIFEYIDAATKTVRLPDDLAAALKKAKEQKNYFDSLSFSHRKEYVEWIVSAKREETRARRISETLERLAKGWKNPANQ